MAQMPKNSGPGESLEKNVGQNRSVDMTDTVLLASLRKGYCYHGRRC